jgi:hypothetical protein
MPLKPSNNRKNIESNFRELHDDNKKKGKEKGANGTPRSNEQIAAIALSQTKKKKNKKYNYEDNH